MDRMLHGRWVHVGDAAYDAYLTQQLGVALRAASATGARVAFLTAPYYLRGLRADGSRFPEDDPARVDRFNALLRAFVAGHRDRAAVIELGSRMSGGRHTYIATVDGVRLRYDGVHPTPAAARWLAPWLLPQLRAEVGAEVAAGSTARG
jgi:lysophospholipase L1-like esterase